METSKEQDESLLRFEVRDLNENLYFRSDSFRNGLEEGDNTRLLKWIRREKQHPLTCFFSPFCFTPLMTMVLESKREDS